MKASLRHGAVTQASHQLTGHGMEAEQNIVHDTCSHIPTTWRLCGREQDNAHDTKACLCEQSRKKRLRHRQQQSRKSRAEQETREVDNVSSAGFQKSSHNAAVDSAGRHHREQEGRRGQPEAHES
eukprot:1161717-Pelagomonas_calceolata.AAC.6